MDRLPRTPRARKHAIGAAIAFILALLALQSLALAKLSGPREHSRPAISSRALRTKLQMRRHRTTVAPSHSGKVDTDRDGLTNWTETHRTKTNPRKADTDGDGLSDWTEVYRTKTNPRKADTDGDGVNDGDEVIAGTNPLDPASFPALPGPGSEAPQPPPPPPVEPIPPPEEPTPEEPAPPVEPPPNTPVHAIWTAPTAAQVGAPATLDGTASGGDAPLACTWSFENQDGNVVWQTQAGCSIAFTFTETGTKYVKLTVNDAGGETDSSKQAFAVTAALPPTDTTPPDTSITSSPASSTTSTSASFSFASTEPGSSFECKLDAAAFGACTSPKSYSGLPVEGHTFSVRATDAAGNTDPTPASQAWTITETTPPAEGSHCFSSPHTCGYPDATNTGVPASTALTPNGNLNVTTAGTTIKGLDVTGSINIAANNVTVENTRVTLNGTGCGPTSTCGNYEIRINEGVTGTVIKDSELRTASGTTCEHDIRNTSGPDLKITRVYMHGCDSNLYGGATMTDSYGVAKLAISTDHVENIYFDDSTFTATHDTLLNPIGQTAVIFGNSNGGTDTTNCRNHLTVTNSLLAGGGYSIYPCAHSSNVGSSTMDIEGNHFARCTTSEVYHPNGGEHTCSGGSDSNGYYPNSGAFGIATNFFSGTGVWKGNVWDDNLAPFCIGGNAGCG